jgi:hypothetical protein
MIEKIEDVIYFLEKVEKNNSLENDKDLKCATLLLQAMKEYHISKFSKVTKEEIDEDNNTAVIMFK